MNPEEIKQFRIHSVPLCRANKSFNKVFGIGANRTGTTSLAAIFQISGLQISPQHEGELLGVQAFKGNLHPLIEYVKRFDAFQDLPFSAKTIYAQMDALFPNSKFILTYRDPEIWFNSFNRYYKSRLGISENEIATQELVKKREYLCRGYYAFTQYSNWLIESDGLSIKKNWDLLFNKKHYINLYLSRYEQIIRHFSERPDDLLVIDLSKEASTKKIIEFLGLPESIITPIPHLNKST